MQSKRDPAFTISAETISFGRHRLPLTSVQSVRVMANLRLIKGNRLTKSEMERLAMLPPLAGLPGSIQITTLERRYLLRGLRDVMSLFDVLTQMNLDVRALYVLSDSVVSYVYPLIQEAEQASAVMA